MRRLLVVLLLLLWPVPLLAQWKVAETAHFRLYGTLPDRALRERAHLLEDFHALLERATGRQPPAGAPRLDVYLVPSMSDASPWRPVAPGVAGFYRADSARISAVALEEVAGSRSADMAQMLLLHEYTHHFMLGTSRSAYPAWYVEGFAEYFATARFRPNRIELGEANPARAVALARQPWIPLEQLLARGASFGRGGNARQFYAQSWLLTHYMFRAPGMRDRLQAYLKAYAAGEDPVKAFKMHVDPDLGAFQARLRTYLRKQASYSRIERTPAAPADVVISALPASADALLLPMVALEHGVPSARREEALADLRARTALYPEDPLAARANALGELVLGSPDVAASQLDQLLNADPRDTDLLRWRAEAARASRKFDGRDEARRYLVRAWSTDATDWRTLHAYARLYRRRSEPLPQPVLDTLIRAYELAPQVTEVVLDTALALNNAGRLEEAARVLEPLAFAPHDSPLSDLAERLLLRVREGDSSGMRSELDRLLRQRQAPAAAGQRR